MKPISDFLENSKYNKCYLIDLDGVLTIQHKSNIEEDQIYLKKYISILSLRKYSKMRFDLCCKKLKINDIEKTKILSTWLKLNSLNHNIINSLNSIKRNKNMICLATDNCPEIAHMFLQHNKISDYFYKFFYPENLKWHRKTEPMYFDLISEELRIDNKNLILIDDTLDNIKCLELTGGKGILYSSVTKIIK